MTSSVVLIDGLTRCWSWSLPYYCGSWANIIGAVAMFIMSQLSNSLGVETAMNVTMMGGRLG